MSPILKPGRRSKFLFDWNAADCLKSSEQALDALTGQAATFSRASWNNAVADRAGALGLVPHSLPAYEWVDLDGDGLRETVGVALQSSRKNLVLQSEDFGTTWATVGTPARTAGALVAGQLSLDLLSDTHSASLDGYSQAVTFTGNGVKAASLFVAQGTSASSVLRLRDTTAGADRLLGVLTWASGVPSLTASTGTVIGDAVQYATVAGVTIWRILFQTASVTAANSHTLYVYPATTSGLATSNTGTLYAGGVQAEDDAYPTGYIPNTSSANTRSADALTYTLNLTPAQIDAAGGLTIYAKMARPAHADASGTLGYYPGIWCLGDYGNGCLTGSFNSSSRFLRAGIIGGSGGDGEASNAVPSSATVDFAARYKQLTTAPAVAVDVGSGFGAYVSGPPEPFSAFHSQTLRLGGLSTNCLDGTLIAVRAQFGLQSLAYMQAG